MFFRQMTAMHLELTMPLSNMQKPATIHITRAAHIRATKVLMT